MTRFLELVRKFRHFIGPNVWKLFWLNVIAGVVLFCAESSFVFVLQGFLRAIGLLGSEKLALPAWYPQSLRFSVFALFCFGLSRGFAYVLKIYLSGKSYQEFMKLQRIRILDYGIRHAGEIPAHEIISVFNDRVGRVGAVIHALAQLILVITSAIFFLLFSAKLAPIELSIGLLALGLMLWPLKSLNKKIEKMSLGLVEEWNITSKSLIQGLQHNFFLRIYALIDREIALGSNAIRKYNAHFVHYYFLSAFKSTLPAVFGVFIVSMITFVSVAYIHTPAIQLVAFFFLFVRFSQACSEINGTLSELRLHFPAFQELYEWHKKVLSENFEKSKLLPRENAENEYIRDGFTTSVKANGIQIKMADIEFGYNQNILFQHFSLQLYRGNTLVVQGESGAGKSTLLRLILGLSSPSRGTISMNGYDIATIREFLSNYIAYVGPEPYLVAGTVRENLLYGHHSPASVKDADFWVALEKAQLEKEIRGLAKGLDEPLQEQAQLSTGQKQRMAIARALLRNPALLILDEASANLDSHTEQNFIESLKPLLPQLTTIIITHKPSFDSIASQKIVLAKK